MLFVMLQVTVICLAGNETKITGIRVYHLSCWLIVLCKYSKFYSILSN